MSKQTSESSEYEIQYRSTIQPRTAVRTQTRQSGGYQPVSGGGEALSERKELKAVGGGGITKHALKAACRSICLMLSAT
uniref:Uncharacterized protein n=1 Tax=Syphacia muris TaxID=451379 RepID=A0A0N5B0K2_9BILA